MVGVRVLMPLKGTPVNPRFYWSTSEDEYLMEVYQDAIEEKYPFGEYPGKGDMLDQRDNDWIARRMTARFGFQFDAHRVKTRMDELWERVPAIWVQRGVKMVGSVGAADHLYWLNTERREFKGKSWWWFHRERFKLLHDLAKLVEGPNVHIALRKTNEEFPLYVSQWKPDEEAQFGMIEGKIQGRFRINHEIREFDTHQEAADALHEYFRKASLAATGT